MNTRAGWRRALGHFVLYGAPFSGAGYIVYKAGHAVPDAVVWPIVIIVSTMTGFYEYDSWRDGQSLGKTLIDLFVKVGAMVAGAATINWWHP